MKMRILICVAVVCPLAALLAGCDDDPVEPVPEGEIVTSVVTSDQFLRNRIYQLNNGREVPGFDPGEHRIDSASIRVFRMMPPGVPQVQDVPWIAAFIDSSGVWADDLSGVEPICSAAFWRPVTFTMAFTREGRLRTLDLGDQSVADEDFLAVCYRVVDRTGTFVAQVGDDPAAGGPPTHAIPGDAENLYHAMKLLKAGASRREAWSFAYELRNVYSLGGWNLDPSSMEVRIEQVGDAPAPDRDEQSRPYIQIFGLDLEDPAGGPPDGRVDHHNQEIFNLQRGLLWFPVGFSRPFAPANPQVTYEAFAQQAEPDWRYGGGSSYLEANQTPQLYDVATPPSELGRYGRFRIVVETRKPPAD